MKFSQVNCSPEVKMALAGMVDSGKIHHAILFHEDDGGGALPVCMGFLQYLYCHNRESGDSCGVCPSCNRVGKLIHPDVHIIFPTAAGYLSDQYMDAFRKLAAANPCFTESELYNALGIEGRNSMIAVAEAKHLLETLSLSALEGGYRSVLIYLPEKMNVDAANRLLKMIEEPPQMTQFLLVTHSPEKVLATISSRCQHIRISPVSEHRDVKYADSGLFEEYIESLLSKNLLSCLEVSEKISALPSRESAKAFCKFAAGSLREIFIAQQRLAGLGQVSAQASGWAARCPKSFPRLAMAVVDRAQMLIDRNVNLKIIFADMTDRLFLLL